MPEYAYGEETLSQLGRVGRCNVLGLNSVHIHDEQAIALLSAIRPEQVYLQGSSTTDATLRSVAQLDGLYRVECNESTTDESIGLLSANKSLYWLNLGSTGVSANCVKPLTGCEGLRVLILTGTGVDDTSCGELARMKGLRVLVLADTAITDEGVSHIAELDGLVCLDVSGTGVSNNGIRAIARMRSLRALGAARTSVSNAGMRLIGTMHNLEVVYLQGTAVEFSENDIGQALDNGAAVDVSLQRMDVRWLSNWDTVRR